MPSSFRRLFRLDRGVRDVERAVEDEITFHFDMTMRELLASGLSQDAARREALRRFGDGPAARERIASIDRGRVAHDRRIEWLSAIGQDLRYAIRGLRNHPGFTAGIVLTLGLGIGANATMFGIVDRLLLRPPAYLQDADRVGMVYLLRNQRDGTVRIDNNLQYQRFEDLRRFSTAFDLMTPYFESGAIVGDGQDARELQVAIFGAELWSAFSVKPVLGRLFIPDDDRGPDGAPVAVLGYDFWRTRYGGASNALG